MTLTGVEASGNPTLCGWEIPHHPLRTVGLLLDFFIDTRVQRERGGRAAHTQEGGLTWHHRSNAVRLPELQRTVQAGARVKPGLGPNPGASSERAELPRV
jgi:hypothetical protein